MGASWRRTGFIAQLHLFSCARRRAFGIFPIVPVCISDDSPMDFGTQDRAPFGCGFSYGFWFDGVVGDRKSVV